MDEFLLTLSDFPIVVFTLLLTSLWLFWFLLPTVKGSVD